MGKSFMAFLENSMCSMLIRHNDSIFVWDVCETFHLSGRAFSQ